MRHGVKSKKFGGGSDANKMLLRKLVVNFLAKGSLTTTETKAKLIKSVLEQLIEKSKASTEANKNYLLRKISRPQTIEYLFTEVGPAFKDIKGGYVKVVKLGYRSSDGAPSAKVIWAHPIVSRIMEAKKETPEEVKKA